ncbi:MAG: hydroxyethylthiazole kinase [Archaeoglobus sp.]|nr:hydroxyethylthiazole kinase [Archaeoglobus sp.]
MELMKHLGRDFDKIREKRPLIHHITNYVAMNDSANATLAIGASPIMAHAHDEVEELVSTASALLINIGTLDNYWFKSMLLAVGAAKKIPILLDPVGAGASKLRTEVALQLLNYNISVVKGNYGEILSLSGDKSAIKGVDSLVSSFEKVSDAVKDLSANYKTIAVATGEVDVISDGKKVYLIKNGTDKFERITASGCMLGSVIASFLAVQKNPLIAAIEGVAVYTIAGELAEEQTGSFKVALLDSLAKIDAKTVGERIKLELY